MVQKISFIFLVIFITAGYADEYVINNKTFPDDFMFGTATSSYQIEGGWNEDGKSPSIWDTITHNKPSFIADRSNGDIACDSYHKYQEDIQLLKDLGVTYYRFSLSWSRILPEGFGGNVNQDGVNYYKNLIKELLNNNIIPVVTIFHWDLPQVVLDKGGFTNEQMEEWFSNYARACFEAFGDDVKYWITINEPKQVCSGGYGYGYMAPGIRSEGVLEYVCAHNLIKAHAAAWHIYDNEFRQKQQGKISITLDCAWHEPGSTLKEDVTAAETAMQFDLGWYANPIFNGDYPEIMKSRVAMRSAGEGYTVSRLPEFTAKQIDYIKGTHDFFGLNTYTSELAKSTPEPEFSTPSRWGDMGIEAYPDPSWMNTTCQFLKVVPWGMRKLLKYIKDTYNDPDIFITENGVCDDGSSLDDDIRTYYVQNYVSNVRDAMEFDNVSVVAYTLWSLMDNFEWQQGYTQKFGIYHVDFNDANRPRSPKKSVDFFKKLLSTKCLVDNCEN